MHKYIVFFKFKGYLNYHVVAADEHEALRSGKAYLESVLAKIDALDDAGNLCIEPQMRVEVAAQRFETVLRTTLGQGDVTDDEDI